MGVIPGGLTRLLDIAREYEATRAEHEAAVVAEATAKARRKELDAKLEELAGLLDAPAKALAPVGDAPEPQEAPRTRKSRKTPEPTAQGVVVQQTGSTAAEPVAEDGPALKGDQRAEVALIIDAEGERAAGLRVAELLGLELVDGEPPAAASGRLVGIRREFLPALPTDCAAVVLTAWRATSGPAGMAPRSRLIAKIRELRKDPAALAKVAGFAKGGAA